MKRFLVALLTVAAVALAGCGAKPEQPAAQPPADQKPAEQQPGQSETEDALLKQVKSKGKLVVGTSPDYPPYEYIDEETGEITGLEVELIQEIAKELGVTIEFEQIDFEAILAAVQAGRVDIGVSGFSYKPDRAEAVDFTDFYLNAGQQLMVKKDSGITGPADLKGKTIAVQMGTTGESEANNIEGATVMPHTKFEVAVMDLLSDRVEAVVGDVTVVANFIAKNPELMAAGEPLSNEQTGMIVRKGEAEFIKAINEALKKIQDDGRFSGLVEKYLD